MSYFSVLESLQKMQEAGVAETKTTGEKQPRAASGRPEIHIEPLVSSRMARIMIRQALFHR